MNSLRRLLKVNLSSGDELGMLVVCELRREIGQCVSFVPFSAASSCKGDKDMKARDLALFAQIKLRIFKNVCVPRFSAEDDASLHFKLFQQALKLLLRGQLLSTE